MNKKDVSSNRDTLRYQFQRKNIAVVSRRHKLPDGTIAEADVIVHPGAALIVPFLEQDRILLLRQYRLALKSYLYEFPAGTLDPDETPLNCARRELREETGYAAKKFKRLGMIYPVPGYATERILIYKAEQLVPSPQKGDPDEVIRVCIFSRREIQKLFRRGRIHDGKTISALAFSGLIAS